MTFTPADIKAGDVLLFHGKGFISWAIRKFDGTDVNHAAVALGKEELAEASATGLRSRAISAPGSGEYILVHRLKATDDLAPVLDKATDYLEKGHFYAYQQIILLAVLCLIRRLPVPRFARRLVRAVLDHAAGALMELLPVGASWMICSEYVYRVFDEAEDSTPDPYALAIPGASFAVAGNGGGTILDWAIAQADDKENRERDIQIGLPVTFADFAQPVDHAQYAAAIEADLAPLIRDYAEKIGEDEDVLEKELPRLPDSSLELRSALAEEPTDHELLNSVANFAVALSLARGGTVAGMDAGISSAGTKIGRAALKGILEGLGKVEVNADFVTPGDLLHSPSLDPMGRLG